MISEGKHVYVVGSRRLLNELMACKILCHTGLKCSCLEDWSKIPLIDADRVPAQRLILYDSLGLTSEELLERLRTLKERLPQSFSLAIYNIRKDAGIETGALDLGVRGFFYENDSVECLTKGVCNIFDGDLWVSRKKMVECLLNNKTTKGQERRSLPVLTRREEEILALIGRGKTNEEIAEQLCVSYHTVRTHIYNIFKKIHVSNRLQASLWATENL